MVSDRGQVKREGGRKRGESGESDRRVGERGKREMIEIG